jgi:hypothetical protein
MATDSVLFQTADELLCAGYSLNGNVFVRAAERMLPLYEAKMVYYFDHRLGTYEGQTQAQANLGTLPRIGDAEHDDSTRLPLPRYWVSDDEVEQRLGSRWSRGWLLGWRDICRSTDERTLIAAVIPRVAVGHTNPVLLIGSGVHQAGALHANLSAFCLDYVVRQKVSGTHITYSLLKQFPVFPPSTYEIAASWDRATGSLREWLTARVLELSYTAYDLAAYAKDLEDNGPPFRWIPERRELMRAELDAAYFHLYGVERDDVDYIMDTFKVVRQKDEAAHGEYRTKRLILECYDAMTSAIRTGVPYQTPLDPPPGEGSRHPWPDTRETGGSQ